MENFCKGLAWGMLAGVCVGAIVVAKNKKLSNKVKEGVSMAEEKFQEVKNSLDDKISEISCECGGTVNSENQNCDCGSNSDNTREIAKNNFSKKNKND